MKSNTDLPIQPTDLPVLRSDQPAAEHTQATTRAAWHRRPAPPSCTDLGLGAGPAVSTSRRLVPVGDR